MMVVIIALGRCMRRTKKLGMPQSTRPRAVNVRANEALMKAI